MKILVLAGGIPQIELIKQLRKKFEGCEIILADYSEHPAAENYVDKFYRESTLDIPAIEKIATEEKVDFLITVCTDQALNTVAEVSEKLGLPCYIDAETGKNVTNKRYMKKVFGEYGIPTAKSMILDTVPESLLQDFSYPLVVKPVDCNSSKGVIKVTNFEEFKTATKSALEYSRTKQAIVEEFIEGKELSVDLYVHEGEPELLCVSESQKIRQEDKFVIYRAIYPSGVPEETLKEIKVIAKQIADAFKLKSCPMLIQMLYREGKLYVVEFSARTGGALKYQLIRQASGADIISATIDATLGQSRPIQKGKSYKYITNEFFYCHYGVFDRVEGFDELEKEGIITNYFVFKNKGTLMDKISNSGDRIASITIATDSYEDLVERHKKAIERVKALDVNGKDILHHGITYPLPERN